MTDTPRLNALRREVAEMTQGPLETKQRHSAGAYDQRWSLIPIGGAWNTVITYFEATHEKDAKAILHAVSIARVMADEGVVERLGKIVFDRMDHDGSTAGMKGAWAEAEIAAHAILEALLALASEAQAR